MRSIVQAAMPTAMASRAIAASAGCGISKDPENVTADEPVEFIPAVLVPPGKEYVSN
jgi:hypothetical protein